MDVFNTECCLSPMHLPDSPLAVLRKLTNLPLENLPLVSIRLLYFVHLLSYCPSLGYGPICYGKLSIFSLFYVFICTKKHKVLKSRKIKPPKLPLPYPWGSEGGELFCKILTFTSAARNLQPCQRNVTTATSKESCATPP